MSHSRRPSGTSSTWLRLVGGLAALTLFGSARLCAEDKPGLPRAQDVLKKAIARARWAEEQKFDIRYTYNQRTTIEQLDSRDRVKKREERLHEVMPIDGEPYARPIQRDGRALSDKELRMEREREQKFRQRLAERRRKKAQGQKDDDEVEFDEELVSRYRFDVIGREEVNGRPALVLDFAPRSHDLPVKRKLDRLLNKLTGKLWLDEEDYEIARADVHLAENVSAWGGMLASVRRFDLWLEQAKVEQTAWLPRFLSAHVDGRILVKSLHLRLEQENSGFRKMAADSGQPGSSR